MTDSIFHIPERLQRGDCIGIFAPAGQIRDTKSLEQGLIILQEMGFEVKFPRNLWPGKGYLADTDSNRAKEFHKMLVDDDVSALLALRGGFGCLRLLPLLDFKTLRKNPKPIIGFSDLTILHNVLCEKSRLLSFHGPTLCSLNSCSPDSLQHFHASLTGNWDKTIRSKTIEILRGGDTVSGYLKGGNLCSLVSLLGTPFQPNFTDSILFLEDIGEPLYKLDRMFSQLAQCSVLSQPSAILLGDFSPSSEIDSLESIRFHEEIWTRVLKLTENTNIPVWGNFPVGHGSTNLTLPHGSLANANSCQASLSFSHP
ncbi:MAG: LD-carboxypeptidase [Desulfocapsa sp.]|nr:MAG: LD-carboxypeptidase [Desulfocapsa sp.]